MARVVILTGKRAVGKTTVCREAVKLARGQGYECAGILTLARDSVRDVYDVRTGDAHRLTQGPGAEPVVIQGRFRFNPETLSWGREVLARSVPCDLLVIDEIGPLELERDRGWASALDVLRSGYFVLALVVVRPELVAQAQRRLSDLNSEVLVTTRENRDRLPPVLAEMLKERVA